MANGQLPKGIPVDTVANAVRRIVRIIIDSGTSYSELAADLETRLPARRLSADTIRHFVNRSRERAHLSDTLLNLYEYIHIARHSFKPFVRECIILHTDIFLSRDFAPSEQPVSKTHVDYDFFVANAYRLLGRMLHAPHDESSRAAAEIEGLYVAFRSSTRFDKAERIVVSRILVGKKEGYPEVTEFRHLIENNIGDQRHSDGFIVSLGANVFLIGDIEFGRGLEMLMIRRPQVAKFDLLFGLILTLDTNGVPTCTKIALHKIPSSLAEGSDFTFPLGPQPTNDVVADMGKDVIDKDGEPFSVDVEKRILPQLPSRATTVNTS